MKLLRVLSRIALLSVVAAAFVGSTRIYGGSVRAPLLSPGWQACEGIGRPHRKSVSFQNSLVKVCKWRSSLWWDV